MRRFLFPFFLFFLISNAFAFESIPLPANGGHVQDLAGVLEPADIAALESTIEQINSETTVEVGIAVIESTNEVPIELLAFQTGNDWGIGKKDVFNGVFIVVAVQDRKWFFATAKGIEGTLPDFITKRIGENNFPPNFKNNDYYSGLFGALYDINAYVSKDPTIRSVYDASQNNADFDFGWLFVIFFGLFIIPFLLPLFFIVPQSKHPILSIIFYPFVPFALLFITSFTGLLESNPWFIGVFFVWFFVSMFIFAILNPGKPGSNNGFGGGGFGGSSGTSSGGWSSGGHSSGGSGFGGGGGFSGGGSGGSW